MLCAMAGLYKFSLERQVLVKRKVLIIVENMPVPMDFRVWKEARSLRDAGYEVTVLCPKGEGYNKTYEFIDGVHIYRHPTAEEGNSPAGIRLGIRLSLCFGSSCTRGGFTCGVVFM